MQVHKIGHSCLVVELNGTRILVDPGAFSREQNELTDIHAVCVTHKHPDHLDTDSLHAVVRNNPEAPVYTNHDVGAVLQDAGIAYERLHDGDTKTVGSITIEGLGEHHAHIYEGMEAVENTGFFFNRYLYHPGDAYRVPWAPVPVLALPVMAPWSKISEALDYAKEVYPKLAFPIHDGQLAFSGPFQQLPERFLPERGITFKQLNGGESLDIS
jgi:L-ascorbate metabolism protein UlaG (beta-lactamase superfamily)